jgi:hypothetical protein
MNSTKVKSSMRRLEQDELSALHGGMNLADVINTGCTYYGAYAVIVAITPGVNLVGGGTIGAFCAGYKLSSWIFG